MARDDKAALGKSGKVGVVGTVGKGIVYLRSKSSKRKNRDVSRNIEIPRTKFKLASHFVNAIASLLAIAFPDSKTKAATRRNALSNVLQYAVRGDYPDFRIEYSKLLMASGRLSLTLSPAATSTEPGVIKFTWKDSTGYWNANATDRPILIAYCEKLNACCFIVSDARRSAETALLPAEHFSGKEVHTWISFLSENGKDVAISSYTGALTVA